MAVEIIRNTIDQEQTNLFKTNVKKEPADEQQTLREILDAIWPIMEIALNVRKHSKGLASVLNSAVNFEKVKQTRKKCTRNKTVTYNGRTKRKPKRMLSFGLCHRRNRKLS